MTEETRPPRPYKCRRCGRHFVRLEHLQRHDRSHTKEKPFKCSLCPQAFTRRDLLTRHNRLTHDANKDQSTLKAQHQAKKQQITAPSPPLSSSSLQSQDLPTINPLHSGLRLDEINQFVQTRSPLDPGQGIPLETLSGAQAQYISSGASHVHQPEVFNVDYFDFLLNNVTLPTNPYSPTFQPPPYFSPEIHVSPHGYNETVPSEHSSGYEASEVPIDSGLSRYGSRLPSLQPEDRKPKPVLSPKKDAKSFQRVTVENCSRFATLLTRYSDVVENDFILPSRHSLHRFISGYISVFHEHFPLLHIPTLCFDDMSLELFLSIAAMGAQYCREWDKARRLARTGKAVAFEHIARRAARKAARKNAIISTDQWQLYDESPDSRIANGIPDEYIHGSPDSCQRELESVQAFILLIAHGMWSKVNPAASDALSMRSILEQLMNELPPKIPHRPNVGPWRNWIACESLKRTKLIGYCFFNLCTLVFDVPPTYMFTTINMALPSSQREWAATNERSWMESRTRKTHSPQFLDAYWYLFSDSTEEVQAPKQISSLGCYVLIHAVIQHVWLLQKAAKSLPSESTISSITETSSVERALKRWRTLWEHDREASIDPLSPHGPLSFNSTALLRVAYIRLSIDSGSVRSLASWDAAHIASSLYNSPALQRSTKSTRAALHCAHALSVPIKLGISYVAHTQVFFWSNQHALCSLECALLLSKWLQAVTAPDISPPRTKDEDRLLDFVLQMVVETEYAAEQDYLLGNHSRLAAVVVKIWAKLYQAESVWEMVEMIGRSLNLYADLLQGDEKLQRQKLEQDLHPQQQQQLTA